MPEDRPGKFTAQKAVEVCQHFELSEQGRGLLRDSFHPRQFVELLIREQHYVDAVRFLAHAVPKREAVWWGCSCVRQAPGADGASAAPLELAEKWVKEPTEEARYAAFSLAEAANFATPAACVAAAAFFAGDSLAPPEAQQVPPPEQLAAQTVANAIILAAVTPDAAQAPEKYAKFLAIGLDIADGKNQWPEPEKTNPTA